MSGHLTTAVMLLQLCLSQEMTDRVASIAGLPTASPPISVSIVETDTSGLNRLAWYIWYKERSIVVLRGHEYLCPHEVTHHLQRMAGRSLAYTRSYEGQWHARRVQRLYWRLHPLEEQDTTTR